MRCISSGKKGWKFGASGKCYIGTGARAKAAAQGRAIKANDRSDAAEDFSMQMKYRRQQMAMNKKPRKPRTNKIPVWLYPFPVETKYSNELVWYVDQIGQVIEKTVNPHIQSLIEQRNQMIPEAAHTDDWSDDAERLMGTVRLGLKDIPFEKGSVSAATANSTNAWNDKEWRKILTSTFGVDVFQREPWLNEELSSFAKENVALITKMEQDLLSDVDSTLQRMVKQGESSGAIAKELEKRTNVSKSRARLIARDQVGKLNGHLTELRQTNIGIEKYKWITAGDERVRDSHKRKNGKTFKWSKPPADTGHPGQDIQCRCYGEPIFDDIIAEIGEEVEPVTVVPEEPGPPKILARDVAIDMLISQASPGLRGAVEAARFIGDTQFSSLMMLGRERRVRSVMQYHQGKKFLNIRGIANLKKLASNNPMLIEQALKMAQRSKTGIRFTKATDLFKDLKKLNLEKIIGAGDIGNSLRVARRSITKLRLRPKGPLNFSDIPKLVHVPDDPKILAKMKTRKPTLAEKPRATFSAHDVLTPSQKAKLTKSKIHQIELDGRLPDAVEAKIRKFEDTIRFNNYESGAIFNSKTGRMYPGTKSTQFRARSVRITGTRTNRVISHNHPGAHSHAFSPADLSNAIEFRELQVRASTEFHVYTMTRPPGKNGRWLTKEQFKNEYNNSLQEFRDYYRENIDMFHDEFRAEAYKIAKSKGWIKQAKPGAPFVMRKREEFQELLDKTWPDAIEAAADEFAREYGWTFRKEKLLDSKQIFKINEAKRLKALKKKRRKGPGPIEEELLPLKTVPELRKEAKDFFSKNPSSKEVVKEYTRSKARLMNEYLNDFEPEILYSKKVEDDIKRTIKNLDNAFNLEYAKFKGTSYRGFMFGNNIKDNKLYESLLNKVEVGSEIKLPSFISTSRSKSYAEAFTTAPKSIFFEIKGKNGMFIDNSVYSQSIEREILFNRDTKFRVIGSSMKTVDRRKIPYILLEEI